jgi:hypothetical protein
MRTTVTLDADVAVQLERLMKEQGLGFKEALNLVLRRGLAGKNGRPRKHYRTRVFDTGDARIAFDSVAQALAIAEGDGYR